MQKIHVRLSVEVEVPDKTFKKIVDDAIWGSGDVLDTEVSWLKDFVDFSNAKPCLDGGWDEGGYIPGNWLAYDAVESGFYDVSELGIRRKDDKK